MSIFRAFEDILGLDRAAPAAGTPQEFFALAGEIRGKLGGKGHLLVSYAEGLTNKLLYCLIHRDAETSRQVFQLILDHGCPIWVGGGDDE